MKCSVGLCCFYFSPLFEIRAEFFLFFSRLTKQDAIQSICSILSYKKKKEKKTIFFLPLADSADTFSPSVPSTILEP